MDKVRIAVIDSGIDKNNLIDEIKNNITCSVGFVLNKDEKIEKIDNPQINNIHGTLIANCIGIICRDVEFVDINILNEGLRAASCCLVRAITEAIDMDVDIINLSLGTTRILSYPKLKRVVNKCVSKGITMVAAVDNSGKTTYPASFHNVIGVRAREDSFIENIDCSGKYFLGAGYVSSKVSINNLEEYKEVCGNSISTAYVTGVVSKILISKGHRVEINNLKDMLIKL